MQTFWNFGNFTKEKSAYMVYFSHMYFLLVIIKMYIFQRKVYYFDNQCKLTILTIHVNDILFGN